MTVSKVNQFRVSVLNLLPKPKDVYSSLRLKYFKVFSFDTAAFYP